jgi:hypothetical protein
MRVFWPAYPMMAGSSAVRWRRGITPQLAAITRRMRRGIAAGRWQRAARKPRNPAARPEPSVLVLPGPMASATNRSSPYGRRNRCRKQSRRLRASSSSRVERPRRSRMLGERHRRDQRACQLARDAAIHCGGGSGAAADQVRMARTAIDTVVAAFPAGKKGVKRERGFANLG